MKDNLRKSKKESTCIIWNTFGSTGINYQRKLGLVLGNRKVQKLQKLSEKKVPEFFQKLGLVLGDRKVQKLQKLSEKKVPEFFQKLGLVLGDRKGRPETTENKEKKTKVQK
jgi:hypothetical protein